MLGKSKPESNTKAAALIGLAIAWGGTALLSNPRSALNDPARPLLFVTGMLLYWALAASVIAIVVLWERKPFRSLWLQPFRWQSVVWGLLLVVLNYAAFFPAGE